MIAYFDASAFVKLAIDEPGTPEIRQVWNAANDRISSNLLYVKARAAIARGYREPG